MSDRARAILDAAPTGPPREFRIFKFGKIETTKGVFLFDDKAAAAVMKDWQAYGNDLCLDYEHKAVDPDARAGDGKAAGWFRLELRDDGLYAVDVRWTRPASQQITDREWRYFSPTFEYDRKTGRILSLVNVALTNIPATKNLPPLVEAARRRPRKDHPMTAKKTAKKIASKKAPAKTAPETTEADKLAAEAAEEEARALASKLADEEDEEEAEDEATEESEDEAEMADDEEDEDDEELADDEPDCDEAPPPKAAKKGSRTSLERDSAITALLAITGKDDVREALGVVKGLKMNADRYAKLSADVEALKIRERRRIVTASVDKAVREGRITPAQREQFVKLGLKDSKMLKGMLESMPKRVATTEDASSEGTPAGSAEISELEAAMCRRLGTLSSYSEAKKAGKLLSLDAFLNPQDG